MQGLRTTGDRRIVGAWTRGVRVLPERSEAAKPGPARWPGGRTRVTMPSMPRTVVIGADGTLTGYAGGIERKRFLLRLEGVTAL